MKCLVLKLLFGHKSSKCLMVKFLLGPKEFEVFNLEPILIQTKKCKVFHFEPITLAISSKCLLLNLNSGDKNLARIEAWISSR